MERKTEKDKVTYTLTPEEWKKFEHTAPILAIFLEGEIIRTTSKETAKLTLNITQNTLSQSLFETFAEKAGIEIEETK